MRFQYHMPRMTPRGSHIWRVKGTPSKTYDERVLVSAAVWALSPDRRTGRTNRFPKRPHRPWSDTARSRSGPEENTSSDRSRKCRFAPFSEYYVGQPSSPRPLPPKTFKSHAVVVHWRYATVVFIFCKLVPGKRPREIARMSDHVKRGGRAKFTASNGVF